MINGSQAGTGAQDKKEYGFFGKEKAYAAFRPNWSLAFAEYSLDLVGCQRSGDEWVHSDGHVPVVASMGAGTGADAAVFKTLGCDVAVIEPNSELLRHAEQSLSSIPQGSARYYNTPAVRSGLAEHSIDLIICAQSIHTMKHIYSAQHLDASQRDSAIGAEEWTRRHWSDVLKDTTSRVCVWYYNPDPSLPSVKKLHEILVSGSESYAVSNSPFVNAEYFKPNHIQPWISADEMTISPRMIVHEVTLKRSNVADWLASYSFAPTGKAFDSIVDDLQTRWFDEFSQGNTITIPYVGYIASGPLRKTAFDMADISKPVSVNDPLFGSYEDNESMR